MRRRAGAGFHGVFPPVGLLGPEELRNWPNKKKPVIECAGMEPGQTSDEGI
jgi:hypothetical protein